MGSFDNQDEREGQFCDRSRSLYRAAPLPGMPEGWLTRVLCAGPERDPLLRSVAETGTVGLTGPGALARPHSDGYTHIAQPPRSRSPHMPDHTGTGDPSSPPEPTPTPSRAPRPQPGGRGP